MDIGIKGECMKYFMMVLIGVGLMVGCADDKPQRNTTQSSVAKEPITNAPFDIYIVKGHEYIATNSFIYHADFCQCKR